MTEAAHSFPLYSPRLSGLIADVSCGGAGYGHCFRLRQAVAFPVCWFDLYLIYNTVDLGLSSVFSNFFANSRERWFIRAVGSCPLILFQGVQTLYSRQ